MALDVARCVFVVAACVAPRVASFRPPAVPLLTFAPMHQKFLLQEAVTAAGATVYWDGSSMDFSVMLMVGESVVQLVGDNSTSGVPYGTQVGPPSCRWCRAAPPRTCNLVPT